jgi:hypothetical protein
MTTASMFGIVARGEGRGGDEEVEGRREGEG